ncbi:MAG: GGDEF domain-containing protein [Solirubrobacterales bacterium]
MPPHARIARIDPTHVLVGLGILMTATAGPFLAGPLGSAVAAALAFCVTAYASFCQPPSVARALVLAVVGALAAGLLLGAAGRPLAQWLVYTAAILTVSETLGLAARRLREIAITDPLTGLFNREGLSLATGRAIASCRRDERPLTLVHIDLDEFKAVNDGFGHLEGDRVLRQCAERWSTVIREQDTLARLGGDEFLLVLPGDDRGEAERLVERLRSCSTIAWSHGSAELGPGESFDDCLRRADAVLYAAKDRRREPRRRLPVDTDPPAVEARPAFFKGGMNPRSPTVV